MARLIHNAATGQTTIDNSFVPSPMPTPVPHRVRKLSLVRACRKTTWGESDLWTQIKSALALQSDEVQEDWDLAVNIFRDDPAFIALFTGLGATSDDIDDVFRLAEKQ